MSLFSNFEKELQKEFNGERGRSGTMELEIIRKENKKRQMDEDILKYTVTILQSTTALLQSINTTRCQEKVPEAAERPPMGDDIIGEILLSILDFTVDQNGNITETDKEPESKKRKIDENANIEEPFEIPLTRSSLKKSRYKPLLFFKKSNLLK